jgi:hypothetical protein
MHMAVEYFKANKEVQDQVMDLVGKYHPDLATVVEEIVVVFRDKASKAGGQVILGTSKKVPPLANALAGEEFKFVLEIAADEWENLDSKQREALLDHLLCACRCEEDPKTGNEKLYVAKPDVTAYRENVERYGMWFPKPKDAAKGDDATDNAVKDMFGNAVEDE